MVLKNGSLLRPQGLGNAVAFFRIEDHTTIGLVNHVILEEAQAS